MLHIREERGLIQGFGCHYLRVRRVWLLFGLLRIWSGVTVRRG